jgi:hypothetical protein
VRCRLRGLAAFIRVARRRRAFVRPEHMPLSRTRRGTAETLIVVTVEHIPNRAIMNL